jgi:hypothetical protein
MKKDKTILLRNDPDVKLNRMRLSISKTGMENKPDAEQSMRKGLSDIGGFRPNLTQPSRFSFGGNPMKSDGEYVLSMEIPKSWVRD